MLKEIWFFTSSSTVILALRHKESQCLLMRVGIALRGSVFSRYRKQPGPIAQLCWMHYTGVNPLFSGRPVLWQLRGNDSEVGRWSFLSNLERERQRESMFVLSVSQNSFPSGNSLKTHSQTWIVLCESHTAAEAAPGKARRISNLSSVYFQPRTYC